MSSHGLHNLPEEELRQHEKECAQQLRLFVNKSEKIPRDLESRIHHVLLELRRRALGVLYLGHQNKYNPHRKKS